MRRCYQYLVFSFTLLCTFSSTAVHAWEGKAEFWFNGSISSDPIKPPTISDKIIYLPVDPPANHQFTHEDVFDETTAICLSAVNDLAANRPPNGTYASYFVRMTEINRCQLYGVTHTGTEQIIPQSYATPIIVTRKNGFDLPGLTAGQPEQCVSNPCDPLSGNKYETETDFDGATTGLPFVRYYNSVSRLMDRDMGPGWNHNYSNFMTTTTAKRVMLDDGRGVELYAAGGGQWAPVSDDDFKVTLVGTDYVLRFDSGEQWTFNSSGRLSAKEDINGRVTTISYSTSGAIETQTITGHYGHTLTLVYDSGRLTQATDANGDTFLYQYDTSPDQRLIGVTDPLGFSRSYHYENTERPGLLTGITDENGDRFATFGYDADGWVNLSEHAASENGGAQESTTLVYDRDNDVTTVTDPAGNVSTYAYHRIRGRYWLDTQTFPDGSTKTWTRDADTDRVTQMKDENGHLTDYVYNGTGQRTQVVEAVGTPEERLTAYQYQSADSDIVTQVTRPSVATGQVATTTFAFGDPNHPYLPTLIQQTGYNVYGNALTPRETAITYSPSGQVTGMDVSGKDDLDRSILVYYDCTTGVECGQLQSVSNTLGHNTTYDLYDGAGRVLQMTEPNGLITSYTYDGRGRVLTTTQQPPAGQGDPRTTTYVYDNVGQLTAVTDPKGLVFEYVYDAAHDLQEVWTKRTDGKIYAKVEYDYDTRGHRTAERVYNAGGGLATDQSMVYDLRNRLAQIDAAITVNTASVTQRVYDAVGNLTAETDPNQSAIEQGGGTALEQTMTYDALNRLFKTVDELGGITRQWYTVADDIEKVRAPNGATTVYRYDDFGNRIKEISPDRGTTTYVYEVWGDLKKQTDARGQVTTYLYDDLKRLRKINTGTVDTIVFTFDTCVGGLGRVCKVVDASGITRYKYDAFGNVTHQQRNIDGVWYNTVYTYDEQDQVRTIKYPSGRKIIYPRDPVGRVYRVKQVVGGVTSDLMTSRNYRGDHQWQKQTLGNGLTESRSYDRQGRLTTLTLADGTTTVYYRHFDYDANGNVTARKVDATQNNPTYDAAFGYDVLDRLTSEDHGNQWQSPVSGEPLLYPTTFDYTDPDGTGWKRNNGNRRQMVRDGTTTNLSYTADSNRLTDDGSQALTYDAAGNLLSKGSESWVYDARGLIHQYGQNGATIATYTYDYRSLRSKKALTGAETVVYLYDLEGQLFAEYEDGTLKREYVWLAGAPLTQIDADVAGDTITWFTTDHLLTPRLGTDSNKEPVWQWDSYAFGETEPYMPTGSSGTLPTANLRFPGQYYDGESDLYYNHFRYYDPAIGRYLTPDPIGLHGGANGFAYVRANPFRWIDPLGLFCTSDFVRHYWFGNGTPIDLGSVGLLDEYQNATAVRSAVDGIKDNVRTKAAIEAQSLCEDCDSEMKFTNFSLSDAVGANVKNEPCLFSVGGSILQRSTNCLVAANCERNTFYFGCILGFKVDDMFDDVFGIGIELPGSTVYPITAKWSQIYLGRGSL